MIIITSNLFFGGFIPVVIIQCPSQGVSWTHQKHFWVFNVDTWVSKLCKTLYISFSWYFQVSASVLLLKAKTWSINHSTDSISILLKISSRAPCAQSGIWFMTMGSLRRLNFPKVVTSIHNQVECSSK